MFFEHVYSFCSIRTVFTKFFKKGTKKSLHCFFAFLVLLYLIKCTLPKRLKNSIFTWARENDVTISIGKYSKSLGGFSLWFTEKKVISLLFWNVWNGTSWQLGVQSTRSLLQILQCSFCEHLLDVCSAPLVFSEMFRKKISQDYPFFRNWFQFCRFSYFTSSC